jgi:glutathione S-transferase
LNPNPSPDQLKPNPDVERSRSMQRNDMENIPIFLVAGFLFTLTQPALWATQTLMYGYVASRLLHAYALGTAKTHDLRAVFFTIGSLIVIGMSLYTLVFALKGLRVRLLHPDCFVNRGQRRYAALVRE